MIKKILSYLLTFMLIVLLLSSITVTILSESILKEEFILKKISQNDYYERTYHDIIETFKDNTIQSGLDESVLDGIITEEKVKNDVNSFIKYLYNGTEMLIDIQTIKTNLTENIDEVIKQNNKKIGKEEEKAINTYIDTIANIYQDGIIYSKQYIEPVYHIISKLQSVIVKTRILLYLVTLILTGVIIIINKKESISYLSIVTLSTGILFVIPKIIESCTMKIENILLFNVAFSKFFIDILKSTILYFLITGILCCLLGTILNIIGSIIKSKKMTEKD